MAEDEKKESMIAEAGNNPYPSEKTLITNIKASKEKGLQTYEVYWLIPDSDEESQERYKCSLKDLIGQGVRNLSTRPNYQLEFVDNVLVNDGHAKCQALADEYVCGAARTSVNRELKEVKTMAIEAGMSMSELKAMIAAHKESLEE